MHKYFCDQCGCSLDPGETCDCKREPEPRVVTYADWEAAGDFDKAVKPGDYVEERIVDEMRDCLPPASMSAGYLQVGEPHSHEHDPETGRWRATFPTFRMKDGRWMYCGNCFAGAITEPAKPERRTET